MTKLIVVLGGTGAQGSSVINAYINDSAWRIRTVTRDPTKPEAKSLADRGVEVVKGDLGDITSLISAFKGANVIFGVTDFWAPLSNPAAQPKLAPGQTFNEYCYDAEVQYGKNIVDAVATTVEDALDLFVFSSLAAAKKWSKGKYTWVYHFDSKAGIYDYIREKYPALAKKTSTVQIGSYADNWKMIGFSAPRKGEDGVYEWLNCCDGDSAIPWVETRKDTGKFVRALVQSAPGKDLLGVSEMITYKDYMALWGKLNAVPARHRRVPEEEYAKNIPEVLRREIIESNYFVQEFGWDGGEPGVLRPSDLTFDVPLTTVEEYIKAQDWSTIIK